MCEWSLRLIRAGLALEEQTQDMGPEHASSESSRHLRGATIASAHGEHLQKRNMLLSEMHNKRLMLSALNTITEIFGGES